MTSAVNLFKSFLFVRVWSSNLHLSSLVFSITVKLKKKNKKKQALVSKSAAKVRPKLTLKLAHWSFYIVQKAKSQVWALQFVLNMAVSVLRPSIWIRKTSSSNAKPLRSMAKQEKSRQPRNERFQPYFRRFSFSWIPQSQDRSRSSITVIAKTGGQWFYRTASNNYFYLTGDL